MRAHIAWMALLVLAACAPGDAETDDVAPLPDPTATLAATYDPEVDQVLLSWDASHVRGCTLDGQDVESSAAGIPLSAPPAPSIVEVSLVCRNQYGDETRTGVRLFYGPDKELVVSDDGVALADLSRLELVHGGLRLDSSSVIDGAIIGDVAVVTRALVIDQGTALTSLEGLASIQVVHGDLVVHADSIKSLAGFDPGRFRGGLVLENADGLGNLTTFPKDVTALGGGLALVNNRSLHSLVGAERLTHIAGDLRVVGNPVLSMFADSEDLGLSGVKEVGGDVVIDGNSELVSLWSRANQLDVIGGSFRAIGNPLLTEVDGLGRLEVLGGDLEIRRNDALLEVPSLFLTDIGGSLLLRDNPLLDDIGTFGVLTHVGGDVVIEENDALPDLDFIVSLETVGGELRVDSNLGLVDVAGLVGLMSVGSNVAIARNPLVCPAEINGVLLDVTYGGTFTNVSNGTGVGCGD